MREGPRAEIGDSLVVDYPSSALELLRTLFVEAAREGQREVAEWHRPPRVLTRLRNRPKQPLGHRKLSSGYLAVKINHNAQEPYRRFAFAHVLSWEIANGRKVPEGHVVVNLDGDKLNCNPRNLYCLSRAELGRWMRFVRCPVDVHLDKLWRQVVALDIPTKLKQSVLDRLEQVTNPEQVPDLVRQRAVCELVQSFINIVRAEISYLRAVGGDGVIPAMEPSRQRLNPDKAPSDKRLGFQGPSADHPWRGLGKREE